jgi:hypothetical protein
MKVPVKQTVPLDQLKTRLEQQFPNYTYSWRGKNILVVKKSATTAALVLSGKDKVTINEAFASMGGQLLFVFSMLLLGILIPLIVYFAAFFPKQKALRNEIAEFVKREYNSDGGSAAGANANSQVSQGAAARTGA